VFTNLGHTADNENLECKACLAIWQTKVCTPIYEGEQTPVRDRFATAGRSHLLILWLGRLNTDSANLRIDRPAQAC